MALAVVQATPQATTTAGASVAVTFTTTPTIGNAIVLAVGMRPLTSAITVTDTAGNPYTLAKQESNASGAVITEIWWCEAITAIASPFTVTATASANVNRLAVALEISGVGVGLLLNQTASATTSGTSAPVGPLAALTADNALLVAAVSTATVQSSLTVTSGWTQYAERVSPAGQPSAEVDGRLLTGATGTTPSVTWTLAGGSFYAAVLVAFKAGAPITPPPDVPVYVVSIGEIEIDPIRATFKIQETIDAPDTMIAEVASDAAPFVRFALGQPVVVTEDGVRVFGGVVTGLREHGLTGPSDRDLVVEIQATSYEISAARRVITSRAVSEVAPETIGDVFAALVTDYYAEVGVALHPDQVAGPGLPAATFTRARGDAVNKQLAASVGYLQSIDFDNRLRAWAPGDLAAPFAYDEMVNHELLSGDITVDRKLQNGYANRVILVGDPITIPDHQDHFTGDGVTDTWPITYQVAGPYPYFVDGAVAFGIVVETVAGTTEAIGGVAAPVGFQWEYDPIAQTIHRRAGPVAASVAFYFPYHGLFIPEGMAEDAGEIATYGLWEHVENVTAVTTTLSAQGYADALLAAKLASKDEIVTLQTRELGFHPGQTMTIASPSRLLSGDYLITQVDSSSDLGRRLVRSITAAKSQNNTHDWRRVYQQWAGASAGEGGTSSTTSSPSGGGTGTGLHAVTHEAGGFDPIKLDDLATPDDNADLNASTTAHGLLRKLSGLDVQVLRGDGTWGMSPLTSGVFAYVFSTTTTAPPGSQRIRFDAGHPYTAATKLWADFDSSNSEDLYWGWMRIRVGSLIMVQDKDDHLQYAEFITTGVPIDHGTYVELPVAWASNGTALAVQAVLVRVTAPAPGGSGSNAFGTIAVSGQSDVVADAAPDTLTLVAGSHITLTTNAGADSVTIAAARLGTIGIVIDGGGSVITTGVKGFVEVPFAATITAATLLSTDAAVTTGSIVIDVWKDTYANYPPVVGDSITASAKPTLSSATKSRDTTLTGWTTAIAAGDVLGFKVDSVATLTRVTLSLTVQGS